LPSLFTATVLPASLSRSPTDALRTSSDAVIRGSSKLPSRAAARAEPVRVIAPRDISSRVPLISLRVASISPLNRSNP
jgi:hypothetical protein